MSLIKRDELARFSVTALMMILILFVYSTQRGVKDALVVSYMGAELLSTIKLFGVLPFAIFIMLGYTKLIDIFKKTTVFHIFNGFFVGFFLIFTFIIHPNKEAMSLKLGFISDAIPVLKFQVSMIENWAVSLFYILSELWGSVMLSLLFWQTCNQIFVIEQAKRLYPLFGLLGQLGLITSGFLSGIYTKKDLTSTGIDWQMSLNYINSSVAVAGLILSICYWTITNKLVDSNLINASTMKKKSKPKFVESLQYVFGSKYIALIATLIICYGISINLVEGVWKKQVGLLFPNPQDYMGFMSNLTLFTGITTAITTICGSYILKRISWKLAAFFTPIMIAVTGVLFFSFMTFRDELGVYMAILSITPLVVSVYAGFSQNILSKATKYAFFDATKEIAYIPLDSELKSKGKAAADVIGGRLGKSGGAMIQYVMLMAIPGSSLLSLAPSFFGIFMLIMIGWFIAVTMLSKKYEEAVHKQKIDEVKDSASS